MHSYRHLFPPDASSNTVPLAFAHDLVPIGEAIDPVQFVIGLENESGQEFYLAENNVLVCFTEPKGQEPILVETHRQVSDQLNRLRGKHPSCWSIYAIDRNDFESRRKALLNMPLLIEP